MKNSRETYHSRMSLYRILSLWQRCRTISGMYIIPSSCGLRAGSLGLVSSNSLNLDSVCTYNTHHATSSKPVVSSQREKPLLRGHSTHEIVQKTAKANPKAPRRRTKHTSPLVTTHTQLGCIGIPCGTAGPHNLELGAGAVPPDTPALF
jgi:hypothetical protein